MKITEKVWFEWGRKEKGEIPSPPSVAKKVDRIPKGIKRPEIFITNMEFSVLYASNTHEKTITEIFRGTGMGYSDVHRTIYNLADRGYLEILGMKKHNMGVFVKSTQKGINTTVEWHNIHINKF